MKKPWELPAYEIRLLFLWVFPPAELGLAYIFHSLSLELGFPGFLLGRAEVHLPACHQFHFYPCLILLFYMPCLDCLSAKSSPKDCSPNRL